jgi:hypothetical protein
MQFAVLFERKTLEKAFRGKVHVVAPADAKPVLDQIAQVMAPLDGRETSTRYRSVRT